MAAAVGWQAQPLVHPGESEEAARTRAAALLDEAHGAAAADAAAAALDADALRACQAGALLRKLGKRGEGGAAGAPTRALFFQVRPCARVAHVLEDAPRACAHAALTRRGALALLFFASLALQVSPDGRALVWGDAAAGSALDRALLLSEARPCRCATCGAACCSLLLARVARAP